jgi:hypothetical protein
MHFRVRVQVAEALGPVNRWYCSQAYGRPVDDPQLLLTYFIKSGGAANFADRYAQAMGPINRWYCSEYYRREVRDDETLWNYYLNHCTAGLPHGLPHGRPGEFNVAC